MAQGSGYTNLQKYLDANQDDRLSNLITSGINDKVTGAKDALTSEQNTFNTGLSGEQNRIGQGFDQAKTTVQKLQSDPSNISDQDVSQYQGALNTQYQGPTGLTGDVQTKSEQVGNLSNLAGTRAGRGELLRSFINSPGYTKNDQSLDELFLGGNVDKDLQGTRQSARRINSDIDNQSNAATSAADQVRTGIPTVANNLKQQTADIGTNLANTVTQRATDDTTQDANFRKAVSSQDLSALSPYGFQVTPAEQTQDTAAQKFGFGGQYYSDLITPSYAQNISPGGVATDQEKAQATALGKLLQDPSYAQYTAGNAYVAPSIASNAVAADQLSNDQYNKLFNNTSIDSLSKYGGYEGLQPLLDKYYGGSLGADLKPNVESESLSALLADLNSGNGSLQDPAFLQAVQGYSQQLSNELGRPQTAKRR